MVPFLQKFTACSYCWEQMQSGKGADLKWVGVAIVAEESGKGEGNLEATMLGEA